MSNPFILKISNTDNGLNLSKRLVHLYYIDPSFTAQLDLGLQLRGKVFFKARGNIIILNIPFNPSVAYKIIAQIDNPLSQPIDNDWNPTTASVISGQGPWVNENGSFVLYKTVADSTSNTNPLIKSGITIPKGTYEVFYNVIGSKDFLEYTENAKLYKANDTVLQYCSMVNNNDNICHCRFNYSTIGSEDNLTNNVCLLDLFKGDRIALQNAINNMDNKSAMETLKGMCPCINSVCTNADLKKTQTYVGKDIAQNCTANSYNITMCQSTFDSNDFSGGGVTVNQTCGQSPIPTPTPTPTPSSPLGKNPLLSLINNPKLIVTIGAAIIVLGFIIYRSGKKE